MPPKLLALIQFYESIYARKLVLEVPALTETELGLYWEECYNKLYTTALAIQKECFQTRNFEFQFLRKYYPILDEILSYLQ